MKQTVNEMMFHSAFVDMGRKDQFSYAGRAALFEWLEQYEEDSGEEMELDVIALCCDFSEYDTAVEAANQYGWDSFQEEEDDEEYEEAALDWLQDNTTIIVFDGGIIIQGF